MPNPSPAEPESSEPGGRAFAYDAFISYSTAADRDLAARLQHQIERMGLPPYRRRRLRLFRDFTSLSADADLQGVIEDALARSRRFILLVSPEAGRSKWVDREVRWWREHRSAADMILVLTSGTIRWDDTGGDWDWTEHTPLPPALRGMFTAEPLWVDLSGQKGHKRRLTRAERERARMELLNGCAAIAAPLRSLDKDVLYGAHITQLRRTRQGLIGGIALLSLLLVLALVAGLIARDQAAVAREQARIATARALASASAANLDDRLDLAQLLAVEAYRMNPGPQSRTALFRAVTAQPHLVRYLSAGSRVTRVAGARDGTTVVAGTAAGVVTAWRGEHRRRHVLGRLGSAVTGLSTSADGSVVAACSASRATVWAGTGRPYDIRLPAGEHAGMIAVSPSGRRILVYGSSDDTLTASLTLFDRRSGRTTRSASVWLGSEAVLPSDDEAVVFSWDGALERRALPSLALRRKTAMPVGNRHFGAALSADGRRFTFTYGAERLGVWRTAQARQDIDHPPLEADSAGPRSSAVALSADGSHAATVANGVILVSAVGRPGADRPPVTELRGNARVAQDTVAFLGTGDRLVSGAGSRIAEWDMSQVGLIGSRRAVRVPTTCDACVPNALTISPDGENAALTSSMGYGIRLYPLLTDRSGAPTRGRRVATGIDDDAPVEPVAWAPSGGRLYFTRGDTGLVESYRVSSGTTVRPVRTARHGNPVLLAVSADSRRLLVLSERAVSVIDLSTGHTVSEVGLTHEATSAMTDNYATWLNGGAAVDPSWTRAAVVAGNGVLSVDLRTGRARRLPGGSAFRVSYEGGYLAVGRGDGSVDLFGARGTRLARTIPEGRQAAGNHFALDPHGTLLAQYRDDGSVMLTDPRDGQDLGALPLSPPSTGAKASMRFTDDGKRLVVFLEAQVFDAVTESPGVLQQWNMTSQAWSAAACRAAGRDLSPAEWRQFAGPRPPGDLRCARS